MKSLIFSIATISLLSFSFKPAGNITEKFTVYGNCGMCKARIEKALDVKGVKYAVWDKETDIVTVKFDPEVVSLQQLHQLVADAGHDTDLVRAKDEVYENLHACCHYERPKQ